MNPFKTWKQFDVEQHNARVDKNYRPPPSPKPQPIVPNVSLGPPPGEVKNPGRVIVRIVSYRRRLLDIDNLSGGCKYHLDSLRYAKLIPEDNPQAISLEVSQVKVAAANLERTEIELVYE